MGVAAHEALRAGLPVERGRPALGPPHARLPQRIDDGSVDDGVGGAAARTHVLKRLWGSAHAVTTCSCSRFLVAVFYFLLFISLLDV